MFAIKSYFKEAIKKDASDLHLVGGELPMLRIEGELQQIEEKPLTNKELETDIFSLISKEQAAKYNEEKELDFGYELDGVRFRVNLHQEQNNIGLAARVIPAEIPTPEDLHFEPTLLEFSNLLDGLVLITGPTGSGKSTTIASIIEEINKTRKAHIVTIEDPIEFIFKDKKSLIEQREVGSDTKSFANALKYVLRQDPNVIFVGEMRDPETIATVLTAAETGHLVFSTLHTSSAAEAVERIVDVFEGSKQKQVLIQLSAVLRGIVAQQLIPAKDKGRAPAREILINTPAVANLIRENSISQIKSAIQTGVKEGMVSMENSLKQLVKEGWITEEAAENRTGRNKKI
ncbi:MAG: type IV pili twitching motility protein PilT [Candidatus Doudnabacteria bacterium RIFCSPHIGHO2_01_FULL_46_14]|uniref:Type IV pili twitching motility protein PilT n=1 Tax=Candidatus Doudnabacteria bacterium RIFCSPHIGHO2_01_FULL_46_14 TaxID=1817824 RepID=A0A1F5NND4_9BACT|nr:MAG: type IV pili twitching motility protein PilT [Candidatus Doudnabacteria bacterium RIFCSPHIGHO2_01_FULL_46_14]